MDVFTLKNLDSTEAAPYARLTEAQLRQAGDRENGLFIAESLKVIKSAVEAGYRPVSLLTERKHIPDVSRELGDDFGAPVYTADPAVLESLTGYRLSRGVLCAMERRPLPTPEQTVHGASRIAVLEGIIDPTNVGAIMRSAAALGMDAVLVGSSCCDPLHRRAARVSMGAVFKIPWTVLPCLADDKKCTDVERLRGLGFVTAAAALTDDSTGLNDTAFIEYPRLAVLLGAEGNGLEARTVSACDLRVRIPMAHGMDSLNVAAASAVLFWVLSKRIGAEA